MVGPGSRSVSTPGMFVYVWWMMLCAVRHVNDDAPIMSKLHDSAAFTQFFSE